MVSKRSGERDRSLGREGLAAACKSRFPEPALLGRGRVHPATAFGTASIGKTKYPSGATTVPAFFDTVFAGRIG
ncbi:MAG TPA: hypothetical protein PKI11_18505 [Candidatus Hydrogenedentes bacterium]|nr:hypothetical protein [Candidatus Hydrogenedentota bacterium]